MKEELAYWIRQKHDDEYCEYMCSSCGLVFLDTNRKCPHCNSEMKSVVDECLVPECYNTNNT